MTIDKRLRDLERAEGPEDKAVVFVLTRRGDLPTPTQEQVDAEVKRRKAQGKGPLFVLSWHGGRWDDTTEPTRKT